ncbi:uncharacterized protein LACBIDRAFT_334933 [Laccaria bicolor S238N-H82]|uniref:Predicted protein n=1 Tax=Laccaria bicolor (strain S238N-H82 / ATCC MYA-4686) TaxID=486041 RepID=B0E0U0_LACBS|nr:uncharacterized protein LACBIDRAFT_334933 [Laccaria bicolor S238N-H82]EDQ99561.1 predicted protein [Laccaria bicolor S238N-H82]|eukprot:XP_001889785.1 predicted protein [Laccaria bicolor S238N-H82]
MIFLSHQVKTNETVLCRHRRPQLFPSALFFATYRILYAAAKALYPYHGPCNYSSSQRSSIFLSVHSPTRADRNFISGICLQRGLSVHNRSIKGSRTHLHMFVLAGSTPLSCQAVIQSHTSDLPLLLCTVLGCCALPPLCLFCDDRRHNILCTNFLPRNPNSAAYRDFSWISRHTIMWLSPAGILVGKPPNPIFVQA